MCKPLLTIVLLAAMLLVPLSQRGSQAATPEAAARVIVKFKPDSSVVRRYALSAGSSRQGAAQMSTERAALLGQRVGLGLRGGRHIAERTQVVFASGLSSQQLAQRLAAESDVEYAVVDERRQRLAAPSDPLYADGQPASPGPAVGQWYLRAPAGAVQSSIDAEAAWALTTGSPSVVVAVLDTGVRFDHADLKRVGEGGNLLPGYDMITNETVSADGDERDADASDPGDFCNGQSSSWHGTQTASLVGAQTDNGLGMASVGRTLRVLPVRVLGKCGGFDSDIQAAMLWAAGLHVEGVPDNATPAKVINLSLGSSGGCPASYADVVDQVNAAGTTVVAAAGNSAGHSVGTPANCSGVIAVAGVRHVGTKVGFSDLGPQIALSAPAGNCVNVDGGPCLYPIITALNAGTTTPIPGSSIYSNSTVYSVGTSFSAPLVAATVGLMLSAQPALTPAEVRRLLQGTARPFPTTGGDNGDGTTVSQCVAPTGTDQLQCYCTTSTCGAGMLDAGAAVKAALGGVLPRITFTPATPLAGQAVELSAASSALPPSHTIASIRWAITDGGGIVSGFTGADDGTTAFVTPSGAGHFTVSLSVTDNLGVTASSSASIEVLAVATPPVTPEPAPQGGGGGGASGGGWLFGLLAGVLALELHRREGGRYLPFLAARHRLRWGIIKAARRRVRAGSGRSRVHGRWQAVGNRRSGQVARGGAADRRLPGRPGAGG